LRFSLRNRTIAEFTLNSSFAKTLNDTIGYAHLFLMCLCADLVLLEHCHDPTRSDGRLPF